MALPLENSREHLILPRVSYNINDHDLVNQNTEATLIEQEMNMTTHQENLRGNPIPGTTNDHVFVATENEILLEPQSSIVTVVPVEREDSTCCKKCMIRFVIVFVFKCVIGSLIYLHSHSNNPPIITHIRSGPTSSSTYPTISSRNDVNTFYETLSRRMENDQTVKNIKKSRLWTGPTCDANECAKAVFKFQQYIDRTVDPCVDFYGFVCGNFDKMAAKNESISSTLEQLRGNVQRQLKSIMMEPPKNKDAKSVVLLKKFFANCMDVTKKKVETKYQILDLIRKLGGWPLLDRSWNSSSFSWMEVTKTARRLGLKYDWFVDFSTDDEGDAILPKISYPVPDLDIYFQISDVDFRAEYLDLVMSVATYYGASSSIGEASQILEFEEKLYDNAVETIQNVAAMKQLWSSSKADGDFSSYGTTTISKIQSRVNHPWLEFVRDMIMSKHHIKASSNIVIRGQDYFEFLDDLLNSDTGKRTAQNYVIWKTLFSLAAYLPEELRNKFKQFRLNTFSLFSETEADRSETCFQSTNLNLFKAVEAEYVRRFVNLGSKAEIKYFVSTAKSVLKLMINEEHNWIDFMTKMRLTDKTREITEVIGGLDVMFKKKDYDKQLGLDSFKFSSNNIIDMFREIQLKRYEEMFSKLYYKYELANYVEKFLTGWTTINAKYHMASNTMILSAATLQGDLYTRGRPNYLNLGAIGTFMSHELAHGIDTSVNFYILKGKVVPWLTVKSKLLNTVQTICIEEEYTKYTKTHPDLELDTNGTISENIADFVGVDVAYRMYQRVIEEQGKDPQLAGMPEYSPNQLFWMQFASMWCSAKDSKSDLARQLGLDEHAFPQFRVNGPLRNSRYFAKDFNCPSDYSYMNPSRKCRLL